MNEQKMILYRPKEVCKILGISYPTFLKYIKGENPTLKAFRMGSQWRVNKKDLERFANEGNLEVSFDLEDIDI